MDVVHSWCAGSKFSEICKMTDVFEGSIIRCMRRLEVGCLLQRLLTNHQELLRQVCAAAKAVGNTELENKFAEGRRDVTIAVLTLTGITRIKRDIVFAASLYL